MVIAFKSSQGDLGSTESDVNIDVNIEFENPFRKSKKDSKFGLV